MFLVENKELNVNLSKLTILRILTKKSYKFTFKIQMIYLYKLLLNGNIYTVLSYHLLL